MGELKNNLSWSKSRDETFRECPRRYYYHYYASWGGWNRQGDPKTRQFYILKNLKSRHMWLGEVVHHTIEDALKHYQRTQELKPEFWLQKITDQMRREFRGSRDRKYLEDPKRNVGLYEHEYESNISDERWAEVHDTARRCFTNFANIFFVERVKPVPVAQWKLIETMQEFHLDGILVYVKIDFAYEEGGYFVIVDWKTGKSEDVDNQIQLDCYGLFSREAFKVPTEKIKTIECNVNLCKNNEYQMIEAKMDFAKHYIRNSILQMKNSLDDVANNKASEENFPFTENEASCRFCFFKKACAKWSINSSSAND